MTATRVVIADDSALIREGVASLMTADGFDVVGDAADLPGLMRLVAEAQPDLVVTDIRMPPSLRDEGVVAAVRIRAETGGRTGVLVLSQYLEVELAIRLLESGERGVGYLLKDRIADAREFLEAARRVALGGSAIDPIVVARLLARHRRAGPLDDLSERERDVLRLMAEGRSNVGIADRLFLTEKTVEGYVGVIFGKLGLEAAPDDHRRVLAAITYLGDRGTV